MQQYTNHFTVATNDRKTEAVLNFYQEAPSFTNGTLDGTETIPLANLVMTTESLKGLHDLIGNLLNDTNK